jgi:hypothetical protein
MTDPGVWNKVSLCKQRIPFSARFPKCSVSSGNRARFQRPFCSVILLIKTDTENGLDLV